MNTPTPEPIVLEQEPEPALSINRILPWPPELTWAFGHSPVVERGDTVVSADLMSPAGGVIALRMRKADGQEYGIELSLPTAAAEGVLPLIQAGMTLAAVGALDIAATADAAAALPAA